MIPLHPIHRISKVAVTGPYHLSLEFTDGISRTICLEPILRGELYGPLRDLRLFNQVRLDEGAGTIVWPNGADFDPATLHDWPEHEQAFRELAESWETVRT